VAFEVVPAHVNEDRHVRERPEAYVRRLAEEKARTIAARMPGRFVLAADTTVVVDGHVLEKPEDADDARRMLRLLSGRSHRVLTGVSLAIPDQTGEGGMRVDTRVVSTEVWFSELAIDEIDGYVASGEPMDKAGAYAVQGLASRFVTRLEGSYSNVVGLPIAVVYQMCTAAGILLS
jgi:septum formation protein